MGPISSRIWSMLVAQPYAPSSHHQRSTATNGLATGGFVVALIGFLLSLIPFVGTVSWVLSPLGLILSGVGLVRSNRLRVGRGLSITGVVLGVLGLIFCIIYTVSFANAVSTIPAPPSVPSAAPAAGAASGASNGASNGGAATPAGSYTAGTYQVGQDIQPGRYKTPGGSFCGWSRNKSDDGQLDSIIANDVLPSGPGSVTVKPSDAFVEFSGDCVWTKQ